MKRVKMYKPKLQNKKVKIDGQITTITEVVSKKHEFIKELGVMDRTLEEFELHGDDAIIVRNIYMEEVKEVKEVVEAEGSPKRTRRTQEQIKSDNK